MKKQNVTACISVGLGAVRHQSKASFKLPLAKPSPAMRNITVPESIHKRFTREVELPAERVQKRAQKALLLQMQQEVLWEGTVIDNTDTALMQHFMKLFSNPKYRSARRMTVVGGREMIRELCEQGHAPKHLLVAEGRKIPDWAYAEEKMEIVHVTRRVAEQCAPGSDGYIGDFELPPPPPKEHLIANKQRMQRVLVLDNVDDPGHLGTLLRSAVGFQYDSVIAINHCADLYDHRVLRAARGVHFASGVPIYTLRDEDGDDVFGMLNHVMERNNLSPVCFAPQADAEREEAGGGVFRSSVVGAKPVALPPKRAPRAALKQQGLDAFCLDRFSGGRAGGDSEGFMLFAGPNHKRNMMRRITERVQRTPVQLLLDDLPAETDMLTSVSIVMHALRPSGDWDYLPLEQRTQSSSPSLQTKFASVSIGANRLSVTEKDLNMDEEEQYREANARNEFRKWRRLYKRQHFSDYDYWVDAESERILEMQRREARRQQRPWEVPEEEPPLRSKGAGEGGMPEWVPNILDEYRQSPDREFLAEEREKSENYTRPPNYDR